MSSPGQAAVRYWALALLLAVLAGLVVWAGWYSPWSKQPEPVEVSVVRPG